MTSKKKSGRSMIFVLEMQMQKSSDRTGQIPFGWRCEYPTSPCSHSGEFGFGGAEIILKANLGTLVINLLKHLSIYLSIHPEKYYVRFNDPINDIQTLKHRDTFSNQDQVCCPGSNYGNKPALSNISNSLMTTQENSPANPS